MTFHGLTERTILDVQLHRALDFEVTGIGISRHANNYKLFLVGCNTIINDLRAYQRSTAAEDLLRQ